MSLKENEEMRFWNCLNPQEIDLLAIGSSIGAFMFSIML